MQEIDIIIEANGDVTIDAKGFQGGECTQLTKELEQALGEVTRRTLKPEHRIAAKVTRKAGA